MNAKELREVVHVKNEIIMQQEKRIKLLEEKMTEFRAKYYHAVFPYETMKSRRIKFHD